MEVGRSSSDVDERFNSLVHSITASIEPMFHNVIVDYFRQWKSDYFISREPERLRSVKPEAYTPLLVSIGPFHHGDGRLKTMERLKTLYLFFLLHRHPEISLHKYVEELVKLETRARNCFAETIPYTKEQFVKMLLLDGCFLVELFRQYDDTKLRQNNDQLFNNHWVFNAVHHDVLLLENQIPFFVLETLFDLTPTGPLESHDLCHLIQVFLGHHKLLGQRDWQICWLMEEPLLFSVLMSITHIERSSSSSSQCTRLPLNWCLGWARCMQPYPNTGEAVSETGPLDQVTTTFESNDACKNEAQRRLKHTKANCAAYVLERCLAKITPQNQAKISQPHPTSLTFIPSATELSRVGITFAVSESSNLFEVRFVQKGVLSIPSLVVDDRTESFLRNLIALEQTFSRTTIIKDRNKFDSKENPTISAYVTLMDCLVNTCADVALLRDQRILYNQLGDDKEVAQLFNKLRTGIIMNPDEFCFSEVFKSVNAYYHTKWNEWWAMFFREFWSTPWRKTSLLAAIFLLVCTFGQTICSILQVLPPWSK